MATFFYSGPLFLLTFLMVSSLLTSASDIQHRKISWVKEPDDNYYIVKKSPVVIVCQAKNAVEIVFTCMGTQIPPTSVEVKDVSVIDPDLIQAEIEVTRADLQNHEGQTPFWCECSAVDIDGQVAITSRKGFISIAHLKNKFETQPVSTIAIVGENVEFECGTPEGNPKPEVMWRKDKKRLEIENNPRFTTTSKDSLVIQSVILEDKGQYQCVARNVAGRRESEEAQLVVAALAESAEPDVELSEESESGKKTSGLGKPRATRQSSKTYFTTEPQEKYYVTQEKPLAIDCGVVAADILTFRCNGKRMDRERQTINQGLDAAGNRVIQSQLSITNADVQAFLTEFGDTQTYQCICAAWFQDSGSPNGWGRLDSSDTLGFVHLAYLDKTFRTEPSDVTAALSSDVTLVCEAPKGQPSPWVYWYKDGNRLDPRSSEKYSVNAKGHLTIHEVQYEDAGLYNCLAENSVNSVQSKAGRLTVTAEALETTTAGPSLDAVPTFPAVIPSTPVFLIDFDAENTLGPDGTKTVACAVVPADQLTIDCGGQRLEAEQYELKSELHTETGKRLLHAKTVITSDMVALNPDDYFCQCTAWFFNQQSSWERVTNSKGYIRQAAETASIGDEFAIVPENTDAYFESEAELVCQPPAGNPTPTVYWLKDGVRIDTEADSNFVVLESGTLIIEYVRVTDEGEYTCVAENEAGSRSSQPVQFTVLGKPTTQAEVTTTSSQVEQSTVAELVTPASEVEEYAFSHDLESEYYIVDDEPVTLYCSVVTIKTLVFVCNGEVLRETATTGHNLILPANNKTVRENFLILTREKVEAYTGPEPYTCLCRAYYQKEGAAPGELQTLSGSPAVIYIAYLSDRFPLEPSDTEVTSSGRVELLCQAPSGVPEPEISWLKDDSPVLESERIRVEDSGTLVIEQFNEEDEGAYVCVANNSITTRTSRSAFVSLSVTPGVDEQVTRPYTTPDEESVEPEPETTSPETETLYSGNRYISKDLHRNYYLVKSKPVNITCEAYNVEFITFICGMQTVQSIVTRERSEELSLPDGKTDFVNVVEATVVVSKNDVENYEPGKEYWCQCYAHYRVPGVEEHQKLTSAKGVVELAYLKKNFQKEPENQVVTEGSSLTIECDPPVGNPPPKVTWTKDEEEIEGLSIVASNVLIIPEVQLKHAGEYICIAENEAAKRMSTPITVEVKAKGSATPVRGVPKCQKLEECKLISSNSLDTSSDSSGLSVQNLCTDTNAFLDCVDQNLADCNVTMYPPEDDVRASLYEIGNWFTQYCNRLILSSTSLASCNEINRCNLNIEQVAANNITYWCSLITSLVDCTSNAINSCNLDELSTDLDDLHLQANEKYCSGDGTIEGEPWAEITPEPEGTAGSSAEVEPEPTGNAQPENSTDDDGDDGDNGGDGNNENREGGPEGKDADNEDLEDAERENEGVAVTEEAEEQFSRHRDTYEEEGDIKEGYFNERVEINNAKENDEDEYAERGRSGVTYENSEEEDANVYKDNIHKSLTEDAEDSVGQGEDEDQGEIETSVVEASKTENGNGAAVLSTSILLATILQLLTVASLSWR